MDKLQKNQQLIDTDFFKNQPTILQALWKYFEWEEHGFNFEQYTIDAVVKDIIDIIEPFVHFKKEGE